MQECPVERIAALWNRNLLAGDIGAFATGEVVIEQFASIIGIRNKLRVSEDLDQHEWTTVPFIIVSRTPVFRSDAGPPAKKSRSSTTISAARPGFTMPVS